MMERLKHGMAHWYDPVLLAKIAVRVVISSVFGAFADRRELVAAVNPVADKPFDPALDYSGRVDTAGEFWFDFIADTGDGWASTRAIAQIASADQVQPHGLAEPLPRGQALVLGGDQVYPTASRGDYEERFIAPWNSAVEEVARRPGQEDNEPDLGDLYAVPGNHDWYDGLIAFGHIFARRTYGAPNVATSARAGKVVARRQTWQVRSYFALKLPNGWWLWGTDSQLEGFIDQPQVDYFRYVAEHWMEPGSKVILCVGQPAWAYINPDDPGRAFNRFAFLSRLITDAKDKRERPMGHQLKLVLTGDSHHYSRYVEDDIHYVTAGGGGAFLHPTHKLRDHIAFEWTSPSPARRWEAKQRRYPRHFALAQQAALADEDNIAAAKPALFPSRRDSWLQSLKTLAFAAYNPKFVLLYAAFYGMLIWAMEARVANAKAGALLARFQSIDGGVVVALKKIAETAIFTPTVVVLMLVMLGIYIYFADWADSQARRIVAGVTHSAGHVALFLTVAALTLPAYGEWFGLQPAKICTRSASPSSPSGAATAKASLNAVAKPTKSQPLRADQLRTMANGQTMCTPSKLPETGGLHAVGSGLLVAFLAALASACWFGFYLWACLSLTGRHWNEAFSAIRIRHFKNMLRIKIGPDGLTLYPIGLRHVPGKDVPAAELRTELIEQPVVIT